jgi:glycosyltransferase involved in cell wall biosynthesis
MNVLLYETGSGFGGSAVSLYRLVKCLNRERFTPYVVVHGSGPRIIEIEAMGISVREVRFVVPFPQNASASIFRNINFYGNFVANTFANAWRIGNIIRKRKINLVHLNNGIYEGFPGLLAAKLTGVPCMTHIRGTVAITRLERLVGGWLTRIVTLNSYMENEYAKAFGPEKVCLVFNGVDLDGYEDVPHGTLRNEYGLDDDRLLIGTVARLVPGKGIPEFLTAASRVLKVLNNATFLIIGDDPFGGSFEKDQKRLCRALGIEGNVIFTGWRKDMPRVLADLDVVVQVSTFPEGMSLAPIEAMALGKPVITSDVPGYTDTVVDGVTGFIVPKGEANILADRIIELATDRNRAKSMGTLARARVKDRFDARMTVRMIERLYDECMGAKELRIENG